MNSYYSYTVATPSSYINIAPFEITGMIDDLYCFIDTGSYSLSITPATVTANAIRINPGNK